jgi:hypothetical protein
MDSWIRALKIFVVVGAIVLVIGTATLVWLLVQRQQAREASAPSVGLIADLPLPAGSRIERMEVVGARVLLQLRAADQQQYLSLVNPATGERISLLRIVPAIP